MRYTLTLLAALMATPATVATVATAATLDEGKCLAEATALIPRSPVVTVKTAVTRAMKPAEAKEYPAGPALWVDVGIDVSGKQATYTYVCAITKAGRVLRLVD